MKRSLLLLLSMLLCGACSTASNKAIVEAPPSYQPATQSTPVRLPEVRAAKLSEVQDAVKRVFKDAAVVDNNYDPSFLPGDFNGDTSQDIAVILKPAPGKLDEMNQEYPPWLLRDPRANRSGRTPLRIEEGEVLLAVIHGYGTNDWRDPEATQTFLLKNVVGSDLKVQSGKEFVKAHSGKRLPRPQGDLIGEKLQGAEGYLYFASATYSWYDPKSFKGEAQQTGVFHKSRVMRAHAQKPAPAVEMITAEELKAKLATNQPITIIDVRSAEGYAASSTTIKGALHFKLRKLKSRVSFAPLKDLPKDREIVTYCACPNDQSSKAAAQTLQASGFTRVKVLQGGWHEWLKAGGPVQQK
ncbi:MAG TPA: rhodanese-like domain-containing protein [Pyrinomonadaceae bacterium]|nr:rhodanese-like domain-containing protein [Pyrinomonadaceae bacterium]